MIQKAAPLEYPARQEHITEAEAWQNIETARRAVEHMPALYKRASPYVFRDLYKAKGIDLEKEFERKTVSVRRENALDDFVKNKDINNIAGLAEALPFYANAPGRLGNYLEANITKTARPDDQGNSFIDFVIEIKNNWLGSKHSPPQAKDLPAKMTFLVDVTTAWAENLESKKYSLRQDLIQGKEASVLCYQNSLGELGIRRPKLIIAKTGEYIERVGAKIGGYITQKAADSFSVNSPDRFDEAYREYFLDFMRTIRSNAQDNIDYMEKLVPDEGRAKLIKKYKQIVAFVDMYEKTPVTRIRD